MVILHAGDNAVKSKAAIALSNLSLAAHEVASEVQKNSGPACSVASVHAWRSGRRNPGKAARAKIAALWPEIAAHLWDEMPPVVPEALSAADMVELGEAVELSDDPAHATSQLAHRLLKHAVVQERHLLQLQAQQDPRAGKTLLELADMCVKLGKLTGQTLSEREVLASQPFKKLLDGLYTVLEPHPEIFAEVQEYLCPREK